MKLWLVEILVRLGVAVIADGRCRPRWYGSDQAKVAGGVRDYCWSHMSFGPMKPRAYYWVRSEVTGSNWQHKQYRRGAKAAIGNSEREMLNSLNHANFYAYRNHPLVRRVLA